MPNTNFLYVITSTDFVEEYPIAIVNSETEAIEWIVENRVEDRAYYYYKTPYIN